MTNPHRRQFLQTTAATALGLGASAAIAADQPAKPRKFGLGLVTYNVAAAWDLDTVLRVCKEVGIAAVEFRTTHKHGVEPSLTKDQRATVKKKCADAGVVIWGSGSVCEFQSPEPDVVKKNIETCKQFVGLVADLGGKGVKVRPNGIPTGADLDKTLEQIGKALVPCGQAGKDAGVEIWVEVHGKTTAVPANMHKIMKTCDHPSVGVTWNSNAEDVEGGSVAKAFELLKPWLRSCHINDLEKDEKKQYPYRELFRLFREVGYDRYTLCEVGKVYNDPDEGTKFLQGYKKLWEELSKG